MCLCFAVLLLLILGANLQVKFDAGKNKVEVKFFARELSDQTFGN